METKNVKKPLMLIALGLAAFVMGSGLLAAQDPVVGSNDPESLFTSKDPKLNTNKQAAMHIMRDLLEAGHWDEAPKWLTEKYIQHNPGAPDGIEGFKAFLAFLREKFPNSHSEIKKVFAEGDYVILHVHAVREPGTRGRAIVDIFRLENGKIVEHWDVAQDIPEKMPHNNGMFLKNPSPHALRARGKGADLSSSCSRRERTQRARC